MYSLCNICVDVSKINLLSMFKKGVAERPVPSQAKVCFRVNYVKAS